MSWLQPPPHGPQIYRPYALELESLLWRGFEECVLPRLRELLHGPSIERACAGWVLARWDTAQGNHQSALNAIRAFHADGKGVQTINHPGPFLLGIQLALACDDQRLAKQWLHQGTTRFGPQPDFALAKLQTERAAGASDVELEKVLAQLCRETGLTPITLASVNAALFDRLESHAAPAAGVNGKHPLVSVIVPTFNAYEHLPTALRGLLAQSWRQLEIIVVDDGSSDNSVEVAQEFAACDGRLRVVQLNRNAGAYAARNAGFAAAIGAFITVHDADDWSHPQKIERQVQPLIEDPSVKATVSHWVRTGNALEMTRWRIEEGWIYRNVSSLMVRAALRDDLGFWDRVRANADTEYYYRILAAYGSGAIREVCPGIPLTFGRTLAGSLTNQSATHMRTQLHGVRHEYMEAAHHWHAAARSPADLKLPKHPYQRPFCAPEAITMNNSQPPESDLDLVRQCELFDAQWYLRNNPDVVQSGMGAARHYLLAGAAENRDPGPRFSTSGYRYAQRLPEDENPMLHFLRTSEDTRAAALPTFEGRLDGEAGDAKRVLVFAHIAGRTQFGAERSFIDMVARLKRDGFAPVVVLPGLGDTAYLERLRDYSLAVEVRPQSWRSGIHPVNGEELLAIKALIRKYEPCEVYVNTLVLEAPLLAARAADLPTVMFVREMPAEDDALCRSLGIGPEDLRLQLMDQVDRFLMPSQVVADWLGCPDRCTVRPNAVEEALFGLPFGPGRILKVALVSSNIAKKGIGDVVAAARMVEAMGQPMRILLVGPETSDLRFQQPYPRNLEIRSYADNPAKAIAQADVVLSLSHFAESFGRTVVEAMAAGRPVICYDRGAPPSLVQSGTTGLVVPADRVDCVVDALLALDSARLQLQKMSRAARARARKIQEQALA